MKKYLFLFFLFVTKTVLGMDIVNTDNYYFSLNSNLSYFLTAKDQELFIPYLNSFDSVFEYINGNNTVGFYNSVELNNRKKDIKFVKGLYLYNYLYNENDYGRIEIGTTKNILSKIHTISPIFIFNNNITELSWFLFPNGKRMFNTDVMTDDNLFKINYITPKLNGFQFAGFYLPDTKNDKMKNGIGGAVKYFYSSSFDLNTTLSVAKFNQVDNYGIVKDKIYEYAASIVLYRQGLQFSSGLKLISGTKEIISKNFDIGLSYEIAGLLIGFSNYTFYISQTDFDNLTILSSKYKFNNTIDFSIGFGNLYLQPKDKISPVLFLGTSIKF